MWLNPDLIGVNGRPARHASIAQLVEQCFRKAEVVGSTPTAGSWQAEKRYRKP